MSEPEAARMMFGKAEDDFMALANMMDRDQFHETIFGFHAQQAVEKALKAWLAMLGVDYPFTHDLSILLKMLEDNGQDMDPYQDLLEFNTYAVFFRYITDESEIEPFNRPQAVKRVGLLMEHVKHFLETA
jgi:HEPN domain-containing protein